MSTKELQETQTLNQDQSTAAHRDEQSDQEFVRMKAMLENAPVNIMLADLDLNLIYLNPSSVNTLRKLEDLLPLPVDQLLGKSIDIFHKKPSHQRSILRDYKSFPHRSIIELGEESLDLLVSATYDEKGDYTGPMVTWEVVTEKLKLEVDNADFQGKLDAISKAQAVVEFNMDGTIITANDNFLNVVDYRLEEIQGQS